MEHRKKATQGAGASGRGSVGRSIGRRRSATKTATWRVLASADTMVLGLVFTGNLATAISIGGFEVITKLVLYFFHERYWARIR